MKEWWKENEVFILGIFVMFCFVSGFASAVSILGRSAGTVGVFVFFVLVDRIARHDAEQKEQINGLDKAMKKLAEELEAAKDDAAYWRRIADEKERE